MLTRAAEALVELDRPDDARARYEAAVSGCRRTCRRCVGLDRLRAQPRATGSRASHAAERAGQALRDNAGKARSYLVAGALAQDHLDDPEERIDRAQSLLRQSLAADPRSLEAFSRLERSLHETRDFPALADALRSAASRSRPTASKLMALHLMLARIARDELRRSRSRAHRAQGGAGAGSRALRGARGARRSAVRRRSSGPTPPRRSSAAPAPRSRAPALKDIFFKLGIIYSEHLPDPKRAVASFTRVLQVTPDDIVALEHLSNLHVKEWEWKGALQATMRLAELETDPHKRVAHLHRVAKIYEEGFKDARHALAALRDALEIDPLLPAVDRRAGQVLRSPVGRAVDARAPRSHRRRACASCSTPIRIDPAPIHALFKIFSWRRAPDRAAFAAGTLEWLGAADADEKTMLAKLTGRDNYPGSSLADPTLDETLFDARVPAGFRNLFRLLDEPLAKMFRADVKRLGVGAPREAAALGPRAARRGQPASPPISACATSISTSPPRIRRRSSSS